MVSYLLESDKDFVVFFEVECDGNCEVEIKWNLNIGIVYSLPRSSIVKLR